MMKKAFALLKELAVKNFPLHKEEIGYISISGFIFLRFFAPAILNPKLFGLRPENPVRLDQLPLIYAINFLFFLLL
jgi:Ras GTPase-activating protein 3